jgi:hypothetical protein
MKYLIKNQVAPGKQALMPLFFRSAYRRRSRIPAAKERSLADGFL